MSSRWLSVRLEFIGNLVLMFAALFAVLSRGTINPGSVGLSLSYALNVTGTLNMLVRQSSEVETNMVSVERIREYQEITEEAAFDLPENDPGQDWPENGVIKFENYQVEKFFIKILLSSPGPEPLSPKPKNPLSLSKWQHSG